MGESRGADPYAGGSMSVPRAEGRVGRYALGVGGVGGDVRGVLQERLVPAWPVSVPDFAYQMRRTMVAWRRSVPDCAYEMRRAIAA
eukprot:2741345-Rhodomonas_salina.2